MSDLVERLRSGRWFGETTGKEAADRIEALEAENERLREALRHQSGVLESRDKFIVDQGLWWTFCNQTARAALKEDTRHD